MGNRKGFTLIELVIVLAMIGILSGAVLPNYLESLRVKLAGMSAEEIREIENAAVKYYVDHNGWPADIPALKNGGYLNANWNGINKFGNAYAVSSDTNAFTVTTTVPTQYTGVVAQVSVQPIVSGTTVSSTIPIPGAMVTGIPAGTIIVWDNTKCGSVSCNPAPDNCPAGYLRVMTMDGTTLRGSNAFTVAAGGSDTHTHGPGSYNLPYTGYHTLTIAEMPAHSHSAITTQNHVGDSGAHSYDMYKSQPGGQTGVTGGDQPHNHPGGATVGTSDAANSWPPYSNVLYCQKQ